MEQPEYAARTAAWFWQAHGCNELADKMAYALITKKINGGMNGWPSRLVYLANAKGTLQV
jgi:putative chitinase